MFIMKELFDGKMQIFATLFLAVSLSRLIIFLVRLYKNRSFVLRLRKAGLVRFTVLENYEAP